MLSRLSYQSARCSVPCDSLTNRVANWKRFESCPLRSTGVVNITTFYLVKIRFESGNESPGIQPSFVSRHIGSGDPIEEWERRSDDCERRRESAENGCPVRDSRDSKRDADLGVKVESSRREADHDRNRGDKKKW